MIFGESNEERARLMVQMACEHELVAMREAAIETDETLRERIYWRHLTDGRKGVELCVSSVARDDVPEGEEPECVATIGAVWVTESPDALHGKTIDLTVHTQVYAEDADNGD